MKVFFTLAMCTIAFAGRGARADDYLQFNEFSVFNQESAENDVLHLKSYASAAVYSDQELRSAVKEAVDICYNAHKSTFNVRIANIKERFVASGAGGGSQERLFVIEDVKCFGEVIIEQLGVLTSQLSLTERRLFWDSAGVEIKSKLKGFCQGHGYESTLSLNDHVDNMIQLKKTFG